MLEPSVPTYRVYIRRPTTPRPVWEWAQTVVAADPPAAIDTAYADWVRACPTPPPPALNLCVTEVNPVGQT
jgi:hypothetical protein